jgi:hypothetical protein
MVRPHTVPVRRPDLRGIVELPMFSFAVVPTMLWPDDRQPPFDKLMESAWQWLITDTERHVNWYDLRSQRPLTATHLARTQLLFLAHPVPPAEVPAEQRQLYLQVRRWVQQDPGRWRLVRKLDYPGQGRLRVYRNLRPLPLEGGGGYVW